MKIIKTKYRSECFHCHQPLMEGTEVRWYPEKHVVRCMEDCEKRIKTTGSSLNWKHRARRNVRQRSGRL